MAESQVEGLKERRLAYLNYVLFGMRNPDIQVSEEIVETEAEIGPAVSRALALVPEVQWVEIFQMEYAAHPMTKGARHEKR